MMLPRQRVIERINHAAMRPVTLLCAPAGYGKSVALDAFLERHAPDALRFNVRHQHASLARFVRAFAAALEPELPRIGQSLAIAYERARQSASASDVLATWLAEHLAGSGRTVAIDDFHHAEADRAIAALVAGTIERTRRDVRWILATRSTAELPYAMWFARGDAALPIDERVLRVDDDEARTLGAAHAPQLDARVVGWLALAADGAPGHLAFTLQTAARHPEIAEPILASGGDTFGRFANEVLRRFSPQERRILIESAAFPEIDEALMSAGDAAPAYAEIAAAAPQIFETRGRYRRFHGLFAGVLLERLRELGDEAVRDASLKAALALEASGRYAEALACYIRDRHEPELVRFVETHGLEFFEAGQGESIHEAIEALDPLVQITSPSVLAIKAMSDSTIGRFDTAESWFQLALDRATGPLREQIAYLYGSHLLRFFRSEAAGVFEGILAREDVSEKLRAYACAALGPAFVFERRPDEARARASEALSLAKRVGLPHVLAKANHQASFVALQTADAGGAKDLASVALAIATEHGFYDVAAGALSVLYNVAADIDDDPAESIRLLEAMGDCAAKSGSLINQLISLVAVLEIEIEAGNEDAAARIETKLRTLDVTFAGRTMYEALLPSRALRAAWAGDFEGAYRLLAGSAGQQWSPDRKALREAEIAAYAAAAGLESAADTAIRSATGLLEGLETVDLRVQRARLTLAFAAIVLGRTEDAAALFAAVDDATGRPLSPRLVALRNALGSLHERYRGQRNQEHVLATLEALSGCGFAGIGRAIAMLRLSDNAIRRAGRLTNAEREAVLRLADDAGTVPEDAVETIVQKLGCADRAAAVRAVRKHRSEFERNARDGRDGRVRSGDE